MDARLLSVDAQDPPKDRTFHGREFRRLLVLVWPFRKRLAVGLVLTVLFAAAHTISLGGVFPVFKILLEPEGLRGWVNRTVAGERLGVDFSAPVDAQSARVIKLGDDSPAARAGLQPNDLITDPRGGPIADLLGEIAQPRPAGARIALQATDLLGQTQNVQIEPRRLNWEMSLLGWAASFIPANAESNAGKLRTLAIILFGLVALIVVANVFRYFGEVLIAGAVLHALLELRARLYERTLHLPMAFFAAQSTADLVGRFVQDIQEIQRGLLTLFGKVIREPLRAVFILVVALKFDWRITLAMVLAAPAVVTIFLLVGRSVKKANRKLLQAYGMMIDALTTSLHNLRVVKAYTAEDHERGRLRQVDRRMFRQQLKLAKLEAFVSPMMETLAILAGSFATIWLASRVLSHDLAPSMFVTLGIILTMLFDPLRKLSDVYVRVQRSTAGAERIFHVLDQRLEIDTNTAHVELPPLERGIEFVDVTFTYPGADAPAIRNVTLSVEKGSTVAVVGPNGSGKTTLMSLLPRFFNPDYGVIRYDGVDLREATLRSLRRQIAMVSQEAVIFAGTPIENIAYGIAAPDEERVRAAAERAYADEFIRNIPGGYAAHLGERGTTLSGGQRQRLAIARAIFRDAPVLIFDEATSQVDTESEQKIQDALKELSKGRTTFIIAHRLSTIQFADRIVVMDHGRVIDTGTHRELFDSCLLYRTLCETQFVTETPRQGAEETGKPGIKSPRDQGTGGGGEGGAV